MPSCSSSSGDLTENVVVLPERRAGGQRQRAEIRTNGGEDVGLFDSAQHDRLMHPVVLERLNQLIELADLDPVDAIDMLLPTPDRFPPHGRRPRRDSPSFRALSAKMIGNRPLPAIRPEPFAAFHMRRLRHERLFLVFLVLAHRPANAPFGPFEKRQDGHHVRLIAELLAFASVTASAMRWPDRNRMS